MKFLLVMTLAAGLAVGVVKTDNPDANQKDLEKLQGTWAFVSVKFAGTAVSADQARQSSYVIKGKNLTVLPAGKSLGPIPFQIDTTLKPKAIDLLRPKVQIGVQPAVGIYELQEDRLLICFAQTGKPRPTAFVSDARIGNTLVICKRVKP
jgi:uncharacterized protein (TIGR03067 family)